MHIITGYENRKVRIELVPLIDTIFLLLVFFIYTITLSKPLNKLKINLPHSEGGSSENNTIVLSIDAENNVYFNGKNVNIVEAVTAASEIIKKEGNKNIIIQGDKKSDLGVTIELIDLLRSAGVKSVSFQVKKKERK